MGHGPLTNNCPHFIVVLRIFLSVSKIENDFCHSDKFRTQHIK